MNDIPINEIALGNSFTEDSYVLGDLFFLPKSLPIKDYHIRLLREWKIERISTDGELTNIGMHKIVKPAPTTVVDPSQIFDKPQGQEAPATETPTPPSSEQTSGILTGLLDSSVVSYTDAYKSWIKFTIEAFNEILIHKRIDKERVVNFIDQMTERVNKNRNNAYMLFGKTFEGVPYLFPKNLETVILSFIIGDSLKLSKLAVSNLAIATLFHDIGMLKIPKSILNKKENLTPDEIKMIQNHTNIGYKYLREVKYSAIIASGALQHHERLDGKGYPMGLPPDRVTEIAKIISVVDAYCAAIASKPFTTSIVHAKEVIQDLLRGGGTAYDPSILKELIKNISFYPIGSFVQLSNDQKARVVGTSGVAMRPIVKTVVEQGDGIIIDLSQKNEIYIKGLYSKKESE